MPKKEIHKDNSSATQYHKDALEHSRIVDEIIKRDKNVLEDLSKL